MPPARRPAGAQEDTPEDQVDCPSSVLLVETEKRYGAWLAAILIAFVDVSAVPDDKLPMLNKLAASAETLIQETPAAGVAMTSAPVAVLDDNVYERSGARR